MPETNTLTTVSPSLRLLYLLHPSTHSTLKQLLPLPALFTPLVHATARAPYKAATKRTISMQMSCCPINAHACAAFANALHRSQMQSRVGFWPACYFERQDLHGLTLHAEPNFASDDGRAKLGHAAATQLGTAFRACAQLHACKCSHARMPACGSPRGGFQSPATPAAGPVACAFSRSHGLSC